MRRVNLAGLFILLARVFFLLPSRLGTTFDLLAAICLVVAGVLMQR